MTDTNTANNVTATVEKTAEKTQEKVPETTPTQETVNPEDIPKILDEADQPELREIAGQYVEKYISLEREMLTLKENLEKQKKEMEEKEKLFEKQKQSAEEKEKQYQEKLKKKEDEDYEECIKIGSRVGMAESVIKATPANHLPTLKQSLLSMDEKLSLKRKSEGITPDPPKSRLSMINSAVSLNTPKGSQYAPRNFSEVSTTKESTGKSEPSSEKRESNGDVKRSSSTPKRPPTSKEMLESAIKQSRHEVEAMTSGLLPIGELNKRMLDAQVKSQKELERVFIKPDDGFN